MTASCSDSDSIERIIEAIVSVMINFEHRLKSKDSPQIVDSSFPAYMEEDRIQAVRGSKAARVRDPDLFLQYQSEEDEGS